MADKTVIIVSHQTNPIKILKWKVKEGNSLSVGRVILLYDFENSKRPEQRRLKSNQAGTVFKVIPTEGSIIKPGDTLLELKPCIHPTVMKDMCAECGADLRKEDKVITASVPMVHSIPELKVNEEIALKLGKADNERLVRDRKLVLLVDLDQTLIHTTNDNIPPNIKDVHHFQLYGPHSPWYHTRLRPRTNDFLKNMSQMYELHICTFGARNYAHTVTTILDRDHSFFSNRILSRDECFDPYSKKANLRALFPCGDNMVCIIDDREDVWNHASNLIHVKPYHFFQHTGDINAPPGLDKHENDDKEGVDLSRLNVKNCSNRIECRNQKNSEKHQKDSVCSEINSKPEIEKLSQLKYDNGEIREKDNEEVTRIDHAELAEKEQDETNLNQSHLQGNITESATPDEKSENDTETSETSIDNVQKLLNSEVTKDNLIFREETEKSVAEVTCDDSKSTNDTTVQNSNSNDVLVPQNTENEFIELEDTDDYLLHLEDILRRIHNRFYEDYDKMESGEVPDLKQVIPNVRSLVLKGKRLVFSGLVPTHAKLEQSKAYLVAKSLGAAVTQEMDDSTTHLVAVRPGTIKVNTARRYRYKQIRIVTPDWLWSCAERWEHVDERVFPVNSKGSKNRHPPPHCSSPEHVPSGGNEEVYNSAEEMLNNSVNFIDSTVAYPVHETPATRKQRTPSGRFMDTINPLMSFSTDDIADMDKEVEDILDDESEESDSGQDKKRQRKQKHESLARDVLANSRTNILTNNESNSSSSSESLTGEYPKGFKRIRAIRNRERAQEIDEENSRDRNSSIDEEEYPSVKFRRGEILDSDLDIGQESNSEGSVDAPDEVDDGEWNMMGAALEREFLSNK